MDKYIGKMLDNRYEIIEIIGVGGMAVVYKARCHRLNRLVAVKILKDEYAQDDEFRRRFHAESQAVAMLSHPNIVSVFDVSRSQDTEYIVMELIDGITLKQYMHKKGTLNWREALHFVTQIVKALSHAHNRGIIHRDIKPHNIMILRDGSVKVADFGIARFASKQNTLTQEALGSVHYISPEQARGSHIDARSDLYSVGVVLYEMLTSRLPYEGDSPVSVAIQHINSVPLSPKEINPDIPDALEMITMKAMAAQLSRRYGSAEVMLRDLEEFRKNPSISFDYDLSDLHPTEGTPDEPTRPIPGGAEAIAAPRKRALDPKAQEEERSRIRKEIIDEENNKTRRSNSLATILVGVLGVLVFLGVMAVVVIQMIGGIINPDKVEQVEVPSFLGKMYDVERFSVEYPDFIFDTIEENSEREERDKIIKQSKQAGELVPVGTSITLHVSLGPKKFPLPDYARMEYRQAQIDLGERGLLVSTTFEKSDSVTKDYVVRTEPAYDETVEKGDKIVLVVSLGPEVKQVLVPNIVGVDENTALERLSQRNLEKGVVTPVESDLPAGYVVSQSIDAGEKVDERTLINYTVSLGPPEVEVSPSDEPSPGTDPVETSMPPEPLITVPTVVDLLTGDGDTRVEIFNGEMRIHDAVYSNSGETVTIDITGHLGDDISIYRNGELWKTFVIG